MNKRISREEFCEVIEAVCKRPKMYTPKGTFNEVVSFIEGCGSNGNIDDGAYHMVTTPFRKWVVYKFRPADTPPADWETTFPLNWEEFLEHFSSEEDALLQLPILYAEYCRFREPEN
ncbi:MAG: hypothetical protein KF855_17990 [Acidobacteria bacterium]|nr:hypothetical protein [Acidobacteriota bacterium]